jgi:hypothetical protein
MKSISKENNFLNWTLKDKQSIDNKACARIMSAYRDEERKPHFSKHYRESLEKFPSVFKKQDGEFSAYASAFAGHKVVMCKNFTPA